MRSQSIEGVEMAYYRKLYGRGDEFRFDYVPEIRYHSNGQDYLEGVSSWERFVTCLLYTSDAADE